jgi:hypothetical protein
MISRNLAITIVLLLLAVLGMALYGLHLRKQALQLQASAVADTKPIAPPVSGPTQKITVFLPDDATGALFRRNITTTLPEEPTLRAREIVHVLINQWQEKDSLHPISNAADVNAAFLLDNGHTAIIDLNDAFADQHRSGILVEELSLASISRTLGQNLPGLAQVRFLVDGKERETLAGHADLTETYSANLDWHVE